MIPAREINLGNIMIHPNSGEPCVIEPQDMLSIMERELNGYNQNYEPIPLDADWLERFGWQKSYPGHGDIYLCKDLQVMRTKFDLDFIHNKLYLKSHYATQDLETQRLPHIEFVHQLQNLYYCLTHTELTTKKEI